MDASQPCWLDVVRFPHQQIMVLLYLGVTPAKVRKCRTRGSMDMSMQSSIVWCRHDTRMWAGKNPTDDAMTVKATIERKLTEALSPTALEVIDDSHKHAGHMGARPEGETHFHIVVASLAFSGLNRVAQQRLVNKILAEELAGPVHALSMDLRAPV